MSKGAAKIEEGGRKLLEMHQPPCCSRNKADVIMSETETKNKSMLLAVTKQAGQSQTRDTKNTIT